MEYKQKGKKNAYKMQRIFGCYVREESENGNVCLCEFACVFSRIDLNG